MVAGSRSDIGFAAKVGTGFAQQTRQKRMKWPQMLQKIVTP
jgi:hypothetical protein